MPTRTRAAAVAVADLPASKLNRDTFGTSGVARLLGCSPKTVADWCNDGKLKHARIPGSQVRRILRADLIAFLRSWNYPVPTALQALRCVGVLLERPIPDVPTLDPFAVSGRVHRSEVAAVLVGCGDGLGAALDMGRAIRKADRTVRLAVVLAADLNPDLLRLKASGEFDRVFAATDGPEVIHAWIEERP